MEPEELGKSMWFQMVGAVLAATEDEAGTSRADVAGGSVTQNYDYLLVSRDGGRVSSLQCDGVFFVAGTRRDVSATSAKYITWRKWLQSQSQMELDERRGRRNCVVVAVGHNAQSENYDEVQARPEEENEITREGASPNPANTKHRTKKTRMTGTQITQGKKKESRTPKPNREPRERRENVGQSNLPAICATLPVRNRFCRNAASV